MKKLMFDSTLKLTYLLVQTFLLWISYQAVEMVLAGEFFWGLLIVSYGLTGLYHNMLVHHQYRMHTSGDKWVKYMSEIREKMTNRDEGT